MWVRFLSANIRDYDLQSLFFMTIQLINGLAHMFPGPRYFPLRLKCVEWLNCLASSSGNFVPLASLVLDILEYKVVKERKNDGNAFNRASLLKVRILTLSLGTGIITKLPLWFDQITRNPVNFRIYVNHH